MFPLFARFKAFYLVGGTALALQIGHRLSADFDFFSERELPRDLIEKVKRVFADARINTTYRSAEQLNLLINGVKTTFLYYPYPVKTRFKKRDGVLIASIYELAAMKAFAIGKRLSYKDYVDWYFLLKEKHVELEKVIKLAKKKFGGDFNARLFLGQLVSMAEISVSKIDFLRDSVDFKRIEKFLEKTVRGFKL